MACRFRPEQLRQALELQAQGYTQAQIAERLGVTRQTVAKYLNAANNRFIRSIERNNGSIKARHISQLEWMASEAIREWEQSKVATETVKLTEKPGDANAAGGALVPSKIETTTTTRTGNTAYLAEARSLLAEVRKVLGIDRDSESIRPADVRQVLDVLATAVGAEKHPALLNALDRILGTN